MQKVLKDNMQIEIRDEQSEDASEIRRITELAFRGKPYAGGDEQDVIDRLRKAHALTLSLVATDGENAHGDRIIGHAAFSPAVLNSGTNPWYALGPISVTPEAQSQRIGSQLINIGLERLAHEGALGCILTGNPEYYRRFGFVVSPMHCPKGEPSEYFMVKQFTKTPLVGKFAFHGAFYGI